MKCKKNQTNPIMTLTICIVLLCLIPEVKTLEKTETIKKKFTVDEFSDCQHI